MLNNKKAPKSEIENAIKALATAKSSLVEKADISNAKISEIKTQTYNGKNIQPNVTVKNGSKTLTKGTDYTVKYSNNKNIGTATVTVTGIGDYQGAKATTFTITPAKVNTTVKSTKAKTANVSIKKVAGSVSGYQVVYANNSKFTKSVTKNVKATNYTIIKLKSKSTLYVKVRAYKTVSGKTIYGAYSTTVKVKVK